MAGDWIKMRTDLYRDPKVCIIADYLMRKDGELARYVDQNCQRDMTVTRNVMRNVTVGALVSVWGVMRQQGRANGSALMCAGVSIEVIDDIADLPGFGAAMALAGWVEETDEGIEFPRFFDEHNVDPVTSKAAASAERQRRYRERQKGVTGVTSDVTRDVTVTHREEREKENTKSPLNPPQGDTTAVVSAKGKSAITLKTFIDACHESGERAIPENDPVMAYADEIGLPHEFLALAWTWFKVRYGDGKRQKDWRAHFRNAVRSNWPKFWYADDAGGWQLTTAGKQAQREAGAKS